MPQFTVNTHRLDPYKNFKFRVKWDNQYVAGLSKMSAIKRTTEVIEWREAGRPLDHPQAPRAHEVRAGDAGVGADARPAAHRTWPTSSTRRRATPRCR